MTIDKVDLFIGRKRTRITQPVRLNVEPEIERYAYHDLPYSVLHAQLYQLFIDDRLFASVRIGARQRYFRAPIRVVKPKHGPIQIHFIKKYVTLH